MVSKKSGNGTPTNEVVVPAPDWSTVVTWDDAVALAPAIYSSNEAFSDGFTFIEGTNKEQLLTVGEMMILDWRVNTDQQTLRDFVTVWAIRREGNHKFKFNDGSTGIFKQLLEYQERVLGIVPIHCNGVRVSEYVATLPDGSKTNAKTYYLF
jgi:hypothetical protein